MDRRNGSPRIDKPAALFLQDLSSKLPANVDVIQEGTNFRIFIEMVGMNNPGFKREEQGELMKEAESRDEMGKWFNFKLVLILAHCD